MYFTKESYKVSILVPYMLLQNCLTVRNSDSVSLKSGCCNWNFLLLLLSIVLGENRQFSSMLCLMDLRSVAMFHQSSFLQAKRGCVLQTSDCSWCFPNIHISLAAGQQKSVTVYLWICNAKWKRKRISLCSLSLLHSTLLLVCCPVLNLQGLVPCRQCWRRVLTCLACGGKKNYPYFHLNSSVFVGFFCPTAFLLCSYLLFWSKVSLLNMHILVVSCYIGNKLFFLTKSLIKHWREGLLQNIHPFWQWMLISSWVQLPDPSWINLTVFPSTPCSLPCLWECQVQVLLFSSLQCLLPLHKIKFN